MSTRKKKIKKKLDKKYTDGGVELQGNDFDLNAIERVT